MRTSVRGVFLSNKTNQFQQRDPTGTCWIPAQKRHARSAAPKRRTADAMATTPRQIEQASAVTRLRMYVCITPKFLNPNQVLWLHEKLDIVVLS